MKHVLPLLTAAILLGTLPAVGAPSAPTPVSPTPIARQVLVPSGVDVEVQPVDVKCGAPYTARVLLKRKDPAKLWGGGVALYLGADKKQAVVSFDYDKSTTKTVDVTLEKTLDCKKALGKPRIVVRQTEAGGFTNGEVYTKEILPKGIKMFAAFDMPPPNQASALWLRRVELMGSCGEQVSPTAVLMLLQGSAQNGSVKLGFGASNGEPSALVSPMTPTKVQLPPSTLDCQAATGIPSLTYTFNGAIPRSGAVEPGEITFQP